MSTHFSILVNHFGYLPSEQDDNHPIYSSLASNTNRVFFTFVTLFPNSVMFLTQNFLVFSDYFCYHISEQKEVPKVPDKGSLGKGNEDTSEVIISKEWFPRNSYGSIGK